MPKILLFRVAHDLSEKLVSELSRAGYDAAASESADVRTVLEQQPDLVLLQTDVRTLDCCGLLVQLKGNGTTAPVKIILLADGAPWSAAMLSTWFVGHLGHHLSQLLEHPRLRSG